MRAVDRLIIFYNGDFGSRAEQLQHEVEKGGVPTGVEHVEVDPIDHSEIFEALRHRVDTLRRRFPEDEFIIHVSPGTPAMHTVWVLLAETGLIERPYRLVQTIPRAYQAGRGVAPEVRIGIDTPLKAYRSAKTALAGEPATGLDSANAASPTLRALYERARTIAQLRVPIMILGERGTGKSTLAAWIRANSPFRNAKNDNAPPQVACGQFSPELMRSELFGHRKGAFTGANSDREGLIARANGDTLFLDEIGDLSKDTQRLLIRAVETGEFSPHGADTVERSKFRLITATNRTWVELAELLDADFLDRVSHFALLAPPLREIRADIPRLWERVLARAAVEAEAPTKALEAVREHSEAIAESLVQHPLPGNFRDLFRAAYHALAFAAAEESNAVTSPDPTAFLDAALQGLNSWSGEHEADATLKVLEACGKRTLLPWAALEGTLPTKEVLNAARKHMAHEIRREARSRGMSEASICDIKTRTVQDWLAK